MDFVPDASIGGWRRRRHLRGRRRPRGLSDFAYPFRTTTALSASPRVRGSRCPQGSRRSLARPAAGAAVFPRRAAGFSCNGFECTSSTRTDPPSSISIKDASPALSFWCACRTRAGKSQSQLGLALLAPVLSKVLPRARRTCVARRPCCTRSTGREGHGGPPVVRN